MAGRITEKEQEFRKGKDQRINMEREIEDAKYGLYAEAWIIADNLLNQAMVNAISLHDKSKIDEIRELLNKCKRKEKIEL